MRRENNELIREENRTVIPFINMFYGVVITSLLLIIIGLLAKFKYIVVNEDYNLENWISGGIILFFSGAFLFGVSLIIIANEEEKEEKGKNYVIIPMDEMPKSIRINPYDFKDEESLKKILFRWHRSTLEESMKTCVEISSLAELNELIKEEYPFTEDIKIEFYGFDYRTGWKTFMVLVDGIPTGWINDELKN